MRELIRQATWAVSAAMAAVVLASCGGAPPKPASLMRTYTLVDEDGRPSGKVVFNPVGGGEVRDSDGTLIGIISAPGGGEPASPAKEGEEKKE